MSREMARYSIERLAGKSVVTDKGSVLGEVVDLIVDELTGKVLSVVVEEVKRSDRSLTRQLKRDAEGNILLPYSTVSSVGDVLIVDEKLLQIYLATRRGD